MTNPADAVMVEAPSKLNLGLRVLRSRADGYHDLLTTFLAVDWADRLTVSWGAPGEASAEGSSAAASSADTMTCSDPSIPADASNLCLRAVHALRSWAAERDAASALLPLHIELEKRIPAGAGLGGGSSDAAATLRAAARIWDLDISDDELRAIAADLGADVPFFLDPRPSLATGIGDRLRPLTARPGMPVEHILIAVPDVHVSTAEAYGGVTPRPPDDAEGDRLVPETDGRRLAAAFVSTDPAVWRRDLVNDFEESVIARYPEIGRLKDEMYAAGALYASMSGSGSAVFGIFQTGDDADTAEARLGGASGIRLQRVAALT